MDHNTSCSCFRNIYSFLMNRWIQREEYNRMEPAQIDITSHGINYLKHVEYADAAEYSPNISKGKVVKVHSDCTISIVASFDDDLSIPPTIHRFTIWLFDRNMQELTSNSTEDQNVSEKMRNILSARILGKMVEIKNITMENHGRIVADVFCENEYVNEWIMENIDIIKLNRT